MTEFISQEASELIGAAIEVHRHLGTGFLEAVYQEALELELRSCKIPFEPQKVFRVTHTCRQLQKPYIADGISFGKMVVDLIRRIHFHPVNNRKFSIISKHPD